MRRRPVPKYTCALCGNPTHSAKLSSKGICYGCPKNPRSRVNRKISLAPKEEEIPKKSRSAFNQERWRSGNFVKPVSLRDKEKKAMAGVLYEDHPGLERSFAP